VAAKRRREIEVSILKKAGVAAVTVEPATSVMDAVKLMKNGGVDTLFVIDQDALLGAFTQRDLAFRVVLGRRDPETTTVREVMSSPAITLRERATVADALEVMAEHRVPQLPIGTRLDARLSHRRRHWWMTAGGVRIDFGLARTVAFPPSAVRER
jgi:CBS domain-containing protein